MSLQPLEREYGITVYNVCNYMTIRQKGGDASRFTQDWEIGRIPSAVVGIQNILQRWIWFHHRMQRPRASRWNTKKDISQKRKYIEGWACFKQMKINPSELRTCFKLFLTNDVCLTMRFKSHPLLSEHSVSSPHLLPSHLCCHLIFKALFLTRSVKR